MRQRLFCRSNSLVHPAAAIDIPKQSRDWHVNFMRMLFLFMFKNVCFRMDSNFNVVPLCLSFYPFLFFLRQRVSFAVRVLVLQSIGPIQISMDPSWKLSEALKIACSAKLFKMVQKFLLRDCNLTSILVSSVADRLLSSAHRK